MKMGFQYGKLVQVNYYYILLLCNVFQLALLKNVCFKKGE